MQTEKPYLRHLTCSDDLKTTPPEIRAAFVQQALEKGRRAIPYVQQARALKVAASKADTPRDLLSISKINAALLTAAGVSGKSEGHIRHEAKDEAIQGLIEKYLVPAGDLFVEELVFRFLLIRGDTLGGVMRNYIGNLAQIKLTNAIIANLSNSGLDYHWSSTREKRWNPSSTYEDMAGETLISGIGWEDGDTHRTLLFNRQVPALEKKNVDAIFLNCEHNESAETIRDYPKYIALGELKGGIDPAGADEHWKTAQSSLERIRDGFKKLDLKPQCFFVAAAIEIYMAHEIWAQLADDRLSNAANLTNSNQVASLVDWLCDL